MKRAQTKAAMLLVLLASCSALPATTFLEKLRAKILASQPFRMDFVQQVFIDGVKTLEESGFIVFADRTRVKWQYLRPDAKTFILEHGAYRFYDRESNQLTRGKVGAANERVIWDLLCAPKPGQSSRWDERTRTILLSVDDGSGRQELKIRIAGDFLPERVEQAAADDVTTVYTFSRYRTGIALAPGEFSLDLPQDVEIIEQE